MAVLEYDIHYATVSESELRDPDYVRELEKTWARKPGLLGWITTTNHKDIAIRYIVTAGIFFVMAGVLALLMRLQLAIPENDFIGPDLYNQLFSVHGTTMLFLFAVPIMEALGLYFVPLMIGTRNVAFPRMNAFGYYVYLAGGLLLWIGLFLNTGVDTGWFSYPPLAGPEFTPGKRVDFWAQMITLTEIAALVASVEIIATVFKMRAPGMSLNRMPLFVWAMLVTSFMVIFAMPSVMLASSMLSMDRLTNVSTHFFNPAEGGDVILYQHLFWFFGHPEVYIIFVPATGLVSTLVVSFSRRPMFGYTAVVLSLVSIGFISFGLWVHHMFATPVPNLGQSFFTAASTLIAIPNGVQTFCWIATIWSGRPRLVTPFLYVVGFILLFVLGGITGVMVGSVPIDLQVHDTFFVVAHFHYVLIGGSVFPLLGAIVYWFPKWTGRLMHEGFGRLTVLLLFVGFNITFFPMHQLGLEGMTRRVYTYLSVTGWGELNLIATIGAGVIAVSILLFVANAAWALRRGRLAGPNPWHSETLEWEAESPPARYNFLHPPTVKSRTPLWSDEPSPVVVGLNAKLREVLVTTTMDAVPDHKYELAKDSLWPLLLAVVVGGTFAGVIFHPIAIPIGAALSALIFFGWFWTGNFPETEEEEGRGEEPGPMPGSEESRTASEMPAGHHDQKRMSASGAAGRVPRPEGIQPKTEGEGRRQKYGGSSSP